MSETGPVQTGPVQTQAIPLQPAKPSALQPILQMLSIALTALELVPATAPEAMGAAALLQIVQVGLGAYRAQTGKPIDLTLIPLESLIP